MFIDRAKIFVKAGNGGAGCNSFRYGRTRRIKIPTGGDGGRGGDIIIRVNKSVGTLLDFRYRRHFKARSGGPGGSNDKKGSNASSQIISVPAGTIIRDLKTSLVLRDLVEPEDEVAIVKGGKGGKGSVHRNPATQGESGENRDLLLELKLIADIGIVGFPNSGKSTLISRISNAKPKTASYPFTTLKPILGILNCNDFKHIVVCDIPGLIEGAHQGRGLGHDFLRHIERTRVLVHLVDMAVAGGEAFKNYLSLNKELEFHNPLLVEKPQIIVANKMDLERSKDNFSDFTSRIGKDVYPRTKNFGGEVYPISALTGQGVDKLIEAICRIT